MKDLTSSNSFRQHNAHNFDKTIARVITSSQWDDKLEEIKAWQQEQERLKHIEVDDGLGEAMDYEATPDISPEAQQQQFLASNKNDYERGIDVLQSELGINQSPQFGQPSPTSGKAKTNMFSRWLMFRNAGKNLSTDEIENNKKLIKMGNNSNSSTTDDGESKFQQDVRMFSEDWHSYLYSYRLSGYLGILSLFGTIAGMSILFTPSYYPLIASLIGLGFNSYKLKKNFDGPLYGNYLGSDNKLLAYLKRCQQQLEQAKAKENQVEQPQNDTNQFDDDDSLFNDDNNGKFSDDDFSDIDDFGEPISDEDVTGLEPSSENPVKQDESQTHHFEQAEFKDDGTSIPPSDINVSNDQELYDAEEEFLKMVYRNRAELSKHLHTPYDILKVFAPLIVNFNNDFADTKTLSRDSWEFKNISYLIGMTYNQISAKFKNAGIGKNAQYNADYYYFIDEITETGLFYKIKVKLPDSVSRNDILKNMENMKNNLKQSTSDVVDISTELPNNVGYFKIYKITTAKDGKNAFLPLVSTGDVMRFDGMKTISGKPLIEDLNEPDDLKILMGLSNAEQALTLDIAGDQNTSIAIAGFTGSGKTASTGSWLTNLLVTHSPDEVGFIILDPKTGSFWNNFRLAPHVLGYFDGQDIEKAPSMMNILKGVEIARQVHLNNDVHAKNYYEARKMFKQHGDWERLKTVPRLMIIMDEQLALGSSLRNLDDDRNAINKPLKNSEKQFSSFYESYKSQIGGLANIVREGGMTIMALSQRTTDKDFPRSLLSASSIKFMMKLQFQKDAERLLGEGAEYPDPTALPTGSGYLMANGLKLTQLTTPLFSGNPDKLEEVTRIIGLAWTIIYDYDHDLNKEPPYYYLSEQSQENVQNMQSQGIEIYNVFNRDKSFKAAKEILAGKKKLHVDPFSKTDFSLDLDADRSQQDIGLQDTKQQYESQKDSIDKSVKENMDIDIKDDLAADKEKQFNKDIANENELNKNDFNKTTVNKDIPSENELNKNDFNETIVNKDIANENELSKNYFNQDKSSQDTDSKNESDFNNGLSLSDLIKQHNNNTNEYNNEQFDNDVGNVHKTDYESEYLQEVLNNNQPKSKLKPHLESDADNNNIIDAEFTEVNSNSSNPVSANATSVKSISTNDVEPNSISNDAVQPNSINADSIQLNSINNDFIKSNAISSNSINTDSIKSNAISSNASDENSLSANKMNTKESAQNTVKQEFDTNKYQDNATDLINFFRDNELNSIETKKLFSIFSPGTIRDAIDKNLISVDSKTNRIKVIYV